MFRRIRFQDDHVRKTRIFPLSGLYPGYFLHKLLGVLRFLTSFTYPISLNIRDEFMSISLPDSVREMKRKKIKK
jgi:hypothetical protein